MLCRRDVDGQLAFDVFNALTLLDNVRFLDQLKFGPGDGFLNYYLFNWKMQGIRGGISTNGQLDTEHPSEVGLVML